MRLMQRPTGDLLVILIAFTICFAVLATGAVTVVFAFIHPTAPLDAPTRLIADIINTLIGLLAGFLAGSTTVGKPKPPDLSHEDTVGE